MLEVGNTSSTAIAAGGQIPFTQIFFDTNNKTFFNSTNNSLNIGRPGIYNVGGSFVFTPADAGQVTISMLVNGVASPTALATFTATAGSTYTFNIPSKYIRTVSSSEGSVSITFVASAAGTLTNANAFIYKVC